MDLNFYLGNISAIIAWLLLTISFWKNKDDGILYLQVLANIFFILNYIFLGAYTGIFVIILEMFRDYLYIRYDDDKKTFIYSLPVYAIIGIFSYSGFWSLFSIFASLNDGYSLIYKGKKVVLLGILTYVLWLIYDLYYFSLANVLAEGIIIASNTVILLTHKDKKKINIKRGSINRRKK